MLRQNNNIKPHIDDSEHFKHFGNKNDKKTAQQYRELYTGVATNIKNKKTKKKKQHTKQTENNVNQEMKINEDTDIISMTFDESQNFDVNFNDYVADEVSNILHLMPVRSLHPIHLNHNSPKLNLYGSCSTTHLCKSLYIAEKNINPLNSKNKEFLHPHLGISEDPGRIVNLDGTSIPTDPNFYLNFNKSNDFLEIITATPKRVQNNKLPFLTNKPKIKYTYTQTTMQDFITQNQSKQNEEDDIDMQNDFNAENEKKIEDVDMQNDENVDMQNDEDVDMQNDEEMEQKKKQKKKKKKKRNHQKRKSKKEKHSI